MKAFAALLDRLVLTPSRNAKLALLVDYFRQTPDPARGWALAVLTGDFKIRAFRPGMIRELVMTRMDEQLFKLSYDYVGDLAETVSLVWPERPGANAIPTLDDVVERLRLMASREALQQVESWLDVLNASERWALLKMVTGGLRIGVSARLAKQALANYGSVKIDEIEDIWHGLEAPYSDLFAWLDGKGEKPSPNIEAPFRPVMLAHPLVSKQERDDPNAIDPELITAEQFAAEWKWDGIRVQAVSEGETRRLFTRTGDDISHSFPDILEDMTFQGALDGELLVRAPDGNVASFSALQKRLNRKTVSKKLLTEAPAFIRAYDILVDEEDDLRSLTFRDRRGRLEAFLQRANSDRFDVSPLVPVSEISDMEQLRNNPPHPDIEGLMLKRWDSVYEAGRPRGPWFKWKRDPFLVDAVIMYAQRGHGRRSGYYSDFTFGVWVPKDDGHELTPVGKAYFGFTDEELKLLDRFVRNNTIDRFGPVRAVTATRDEGLVVEIAFEGLQRSPRHKSGIAMRFPRFHRIRWDKPTREADTLASLEVLLTA